MYRAMITDGKSTDGYYVLQWTSKPYTLQEDKEMEDYTPTITAYTGEIVCDVVFLNPVPTAKYWHISMKIGVGDIIVKLKQVLLPNTTMMKIDKINKLPKRCKKKVPCKFYSEGFVTINHKIPLGIRFLQNRIR